jgi:hypothetical protein
LTMLFAQVLVTAATGATAFALTKDRTLSST